MADMLKAAGDEGLVWNAVVKLKEGRRKEDWCRSWMVNVYKGKGDVMGCGHQIAIVGRFSKEL